MKEERFLVHLSESSDLATDEDMIECTVNAVYATLKNFTNWSVSRKFSCLQLNFQHFAAPSPRIQQTIIPIYAETRHKHFLQIGELTVVALELASLRVKHLKLHACISASDELTWVSIVKLNVCYLEIAWLRNRLRTL